MTEPSHEPEIIEAEVAPRGEQEPVLAQPAPKPPRPVAVWVLAALYVLGALVLTGKTLLLWQNSVYGLPSDGASLLWQFFRYELVILLLLAAAAGLWWGQRWGWCVAGFTHLLCALYLGESIRFDLEFMQLARSIPGGSELGRWMQIYTSAAQIAVHIGVFLYLFTPPMVDFCEISQTSRLRLGIVLVALAGLFLGAQYFVLGVF